MNRDLFFGERPTIILEGPDRAGKTTVRREIQRLTNFGCMVIDRCFLSNAVYRYLRTDDYNLFKEDLSEIADIYDVLRRTGFRVIEVLITSGYLVLNERAAKTNHEEITNKHILAFEEAYDFVHGPIETNPRTYLRIDSSLHEPTRIAEAIIEKVYATFKIEAITR